MKRLYNFAANRLVAKRPYNGFRISEYGILYSLLVVFSGLQASRALFSIPKAGFRIPDSGFQSPRVSISQDIVLDSEYGLPYMGRLE